MLRLAIFLALALNLAACGGGSGDGGGESSRPVFPAGGVREADGTTSYCGDFQLVEWPPLRFENNTWGREGVTGWNQCILAHEGEAGIEFGWRWDWPGDRGQVKGFPEVHYGQKPFFSNPSSAPDIPIRIADIEEMTVRYDVDMIAEGTYNLAFDTFLYPTDLPDNPTWAGRTPTRPTHEIMVWVDRTRHFGVQPEEYFVEEATIDGTAYEFWRHDQFDPHNQTRPAGETPDTLWDILQFVPVDCPCPANRYNDTLDLAAFYDWLVDEGHVDPAYWVTVIEFGNEVIEGSGETWLREYKVTVR